MIKKTIYLLMLVCLAGCTPAGISSDSPVQPEEQPLAQDVPDTLPTPLPTREPYAPGTLVDYIAQTGDTLPALAARFNTGIDEIRIANPIIPPDATTMPPGFPMKIPIYYRPLWGNPYQIIPDSLFVNGPSQVAFDAIGFVDGQPGWFKNHVEYLGDQNRRGGEIVNYIASNFSISPQFLLAVIEFQTGGLTESELPDNLDLYPLGYADIYHKGLGRQLTWAANILNNGYYGWRTGAMIEFYHPDGRQERPDPWQNSATVALQFYFSRILEREAYTFSIGSEGFYKTYRDLYGDPWANVEPHIPGSLRQPDMSLPFSPGKSWAYTGGPHTGWGEGAPLAAIDFAPPSVVGGCGVTEEPATAVADGVIVRKGDALVVLDLDGDMDERTGWVVFYLHLANQSLPAVGTALKAGDPVGLPSCEGGRATGTHVHIARKYNGEWVPAEGALAFNLEGWVAKNGSTEYEGTLTRFGRTVEACVCSDINSQIQAAIR